MKVVINDCFGGFSLSHKAVMRYAEIEGIKLYPFVDVAPIGSRVFEPYTGQSDLIHYSTKPLTPEGGYEEDSYFSDLDIERDDLALIQVVEELGSDANGGCASLKIVEIPDGIEWEIDEYDGSETIDEKHRSWS